MSVVEDRRILSLELAFESNVDYFDNLLISHKITQDQYETLYKQQVEYLEERIAKIRSGEI